MDKDLVKKIQDNPKFQELVTKRESLAWRLTIAMLVIYFGYILIIAFVPSLFAIKISGAITLGIPVGIIVILSAFILTGLYVKKANSEFDDLTNQVIEESRSDK
ncbi:MAG: DUF485 domain-containing protein [Campylobacterales bacterium]